MAKLNVESKDYVKLLKDQEFKRKRRRELAALIAKAKTMHRHLDGKKHQYTDLRCPMCGNRVEYTVYGDTGKTSGRCLTRACLWWIEDGVVKEDD